MEFHRARTVHRHATGPKITGPASRATSFRRHRYTGRKARRLRNYDAIIVAPRALNYTALEALAYVAKQVTLRRSREYLLERCGEGEGRGSHRGDGSKRRDLT
ncbi:uncharacterized protein [Anoplolepis gracilipes]|uniref:uncharacterized protein n=1 Tax=Anoplolepis gracilipes TaxID=354296 RepID=UPI003BA32ECA